MELRERIARAVCPHLGYEFAEWDESLDEDRETALEIADGVIEALGFTREEIRIAPRPESMTKFAPHMVERYATQWVRADDR